MTTQNYVSYRDRLVGAVSRAIDGDTYTHVQNSLIVRNGELYRDELNENADICVLYRDGRMETK